MVQIKVPEPDAEIEQLLFTLVAAVGDLSRAMMNGPRTGPRTVLVPRLVEVYACLERIASCCGISLADAAQDKIEKNNKKYRASECYGKREKYTAYENKQDWQLPLTASCVVAGAMAAWYCFKK